MAEANEFSVSLDDFGGVARLFPLPNLVLFPHVMQPLHVFEPRYRDLLADALESDRLMALGLLKPGWEAQYEDRPPIYPVACLGRIVTSHQLANGSSNLLLMGLKRVRLVRELPADRTFRLAEVDVIEDIVPEDGDSTWPGLRRDLHAMLHRILPDHPQVEEQLTQLLQAGVDLGTLTDVISYASGLELRQKQRLLAEPKIVRRARLLLSDLAKLVSDDSTDRTLEYPPDFSDN